MAKLSTGLISSIKNKVLGSTEKGSKTPSKESASLSKIVAKNFLALSGMARDLNVASKNVMELVRVMGGNPREKEDMYFLKESEREKKLEVELEKESKKPKKIKTAADVAKKAILFKLALTVLKTFMSVIVKYLAPVVLIGTIVYAIKDSFVEWAKGLWESIKESFDNFVTNIKTWFNESVDGIVTGIKNFIDNMIETISGFFSKIGDFFVSYFEIWKNIITAPFRAISFVYNKFKDMVQSILDKIPDWVKEKLGLKPKQEKPEITKVDDSAERKKLERQQKEALDREKSRKKEEKIAEASKQEEKIAETKKKLSIAEKRGNLKEVSKLNKELGKLEAEEMKAKEQPVKPAPTTPTPTQQATTPAVPTPSVPDGKKEEKVTQVPGGIQGLIVDSLKEVGITSQKALANILATVKAESNFKVQSENLNYSSADRIQAVFGKKRIPTVEFAQQFVKNPQALANHVYKTTDGNSEPGDGWKYRGRGFIQHTGKNQYAALSKFTGIDLIKNPDALNEPSVAAKAIAWFLLSYKRLKPEDLENMSKVNKAIAFADPSGQKALAREESASQIYASMTSPGGTQVASASTDLASGQRQQQKPQTPVIVNAPTTNTTVVKNNQVASAPQKNTAGILTARAA
jgi:putative chitinase